MKKIKALIIAFTILITVFTGSCASNPSVSTHPVTVDNVSSATSLATIDALDITIREASDYLNDNIPRGNRIVILNIESNSSDLSDYIIDELIANAVNDRLFSVVDRQQLEAIRAEQNFQLSGEVDDNEALAIGRFFGAQTIVSGAVNRLGSDHRIRIRALDVQTAEVQGQFNRNIVSSQIITSLVLNDRNISQASSQAGTIPTVSVITPQGNNLVQQIVWIGNQGGNSATYEIVVNNDENIRPTIISTRGQNTTIIIRSENPATPRIIQLSGQGHLFSVSANITLILQDIILRGHNNNTGALVSVETSGVLILNSGTKITMNTNTNNQSADNQRGGGGILVIRGTLEMNDGAEISGNTSSNGRGGGIYISEGTFNMNNGTITGNSSRWAGGGIGIFGSGGIFNMNNGIISGNISGSNGGGVAAGENAVFVKSGNGGIIFGIDAVGTQANRANMVPFGHAVSTEYGGGCNNTVQPNQVLNTRLSGRAAGWDVLW